MGLPFWIGLIAFLYVAIGITYVLIEEHHEKISRRPSIFSKSLKYFALEMAVAALAGTPCLARELSDAGLFALQNFLRRRREEHSSSSPSSERYYEYENGEGEDQN